VLGIVIADYAIYRSPSGEQEDYMGSLRGGQSVKVLRQEKTGEVLWYLCEWSDNDLISQGWIQAERINLFDFNGINLPTGNTPTP
jgi:hypothetical protein